MKKLIFLLIFSTSFNAFSQVKLSPGFRIGMNYSTILVPSDFEYYTNDPTTFTSSRVENYGYNYKKGLYIGALLNIQYSKSYALQPELTYSNQGAKAEFLNDKNINIHFFSIGAINKFFIMKDEKFHLLVGTSLDFIINKSDLINEEEYELNRGVKNGIDFSFFLGLGYQFNSGLTFEARYKRGTRGVFSDDYIILLKKDSHRSSLFQFGIAYKFDLKKESKKFVK